MYLDKNQLAESFGISIKMIDDWVAHEELPHHLDRERELFNKNEVRRWAEQKEISVHAGFLENIPSVFMVKSELKRMLELGGIRRDVTQSNLLNEMAAAVNDLPGIPTTICEMLAERIQKPDHLVWAPIGDGFAVPHLKTRVALGRDAGVVSFLLLKEPLDVGNEAVDDQPITRLAFFIPPTPSSHLDVLARLSKALHSKQFRDVLESGTDEDIFATLEAVEKKRR